MINVWGRKKKIAVPDDTGEAQIMRDESKEELKRLQRQRYEVASITDRLHRRRELNHFGEEITVSFRPRGRHT